MKKGIDTDEFAMRINILRVKMEGFHREFTREELAGLLKTYGLPYSVSYFSAYVNHNIIVRKDRGTYQLPEEPVYKGIIETALQSIRKYKLDSMKRLSGKAAKEQEMAQIEEYIQFLKGKGYLVFKQM